MVVQPPGSAMVLLLLACIEHTLHDDNAAFDSGTTPFDSDPISTDDSGTAPTECDSTPPDGSVVADIECGGATAPFSGQFVERWKVHPERSYFTELGTARLEDGNGDGVVDGEDPVFVLGRDSHGAPQGMVVLDEDGNIGWRSDARDVLMSSSGDVDPAHVGSEVVAVGTFSWGGGSLDVASNTDLLWSAGIDPELVNYPWITDLEGDGTAEIVLGHAVLDATTGAVRATLEGTWPGDGTPAISADLDRDGIEEIIAANWSAGAVRLYGADGSLRATCVTDGGMAYNASYAVGNLDEDDDGEFIAAGNGYVAKCDSDGTQIAEVYMDSVQPALVALAQLDDDPAPEVLFSDSDLIALDDDLSPLWVFVCEVGACPFSVADLDGDGRHEILLNILGNLSVVAPWGVELARTTEYAGFLGSWRSQPIVADLDGDGLAEIIIAGSDLVVLSSPEGGWPASGADAEWPASDHHPGDRGPGGTLPGPAAWWTDPAQNVWQGWPAGVAGDAELTVTVDDVCIESCEGDALVTVEVANRSNVAIYQPVTVQLDDVDRSEPLGSATIPPPFLSATTRYATFRVDADRVADGLRATVDPEGAVAECGDLPNEDTWRDTPWP